MEDMRAPSFFMTFYCDYILLENRDNKLLWFLLGLLTNSMCMHNSHAYSFIKFYADYLSEVVDR